MKRQYWIFLAAAGLAITGAVWLLVSKTVTVDVRLSDPIPLASIPLPEMNRKPSSASSVETSTAAPDLFSSQDGKRVRDRGIDLPGYYYPVTEEVVAGKFRLDVIALGSSKEFDEFEEKGQTIPTWTPAMFVFEDMTSDEITGDNGAYRKNSPRSFCKSYRITREALHLDCHDPQVGKVTFSGSITSEFVTGLENGRAAIIGDVTVGDKVFHDVGFRYWAGD